MIQVNNCQTELTKELLDELSKEEQDALFDYINTVPYIQKLISPTRKRAKDLPRDKEGKIIVDVCDPHIIEDMEYFRPAGNHYKQHGVYTFLRPNGNPHSEFGKYIRQELDRCLNGMVRPSDGEWVTGDFYFYLNYCPIRLTKVDENSESKHAARVTDFPEIWESNYFWFHYVHQARYGGKYNEGKGGNHACLIAKRGVGKSFSAGAMLARLFTLGASEEEVAEVVGVVTAYEKEYLTKDGILNKFISMADFIAESTQFPSIRYKNSLNEMNWVMGYQDADTGTIKGSKNEILGVSVKDQPDKIRGKRAHRMIFEEFGRFPKFLDTWNTSRFNVEDGMYVFGQLIAFGTGGTTGSDFSGALEMLYKPVGYNVYAIPNVFDRNSQGKTLSVFFIGAYMNMKGFFNNDGVSDVTGALVAEIKQRTKIKYNSSDTLALTQRKAEMPFTIQEAIMRRDGTIYPVSDLTERVVQIDTNNSIVDNMWIGKLVINDQRKVEYKLDPDVKMIREFPHKDNKLEGAIVIKEMPEKDSSGKVPWGRYIAGIDPYDDDVSNTLSLGALYILDLFTDKLVFEYVGRPQFAEDFYENCRRALLFYNAECNYENNKKGLFAYFSKHNSLYLLSDTLEFLRDKDLIKATNLYGNKAHPYSQKVPTLDGWKKWSEIEIGDYLFDTIGSLTQVKAIPFNDYSDIYNITLKDGRVIQASGNHLWKVIDWNGKEKVVSTLELCSGYRSKGKYKEYKYYIPKNEGVEFRKQDIPIDPYILGLALGDGCFTQTSLNQLYFTSSEEDMEYYKPFFNTEIKKLDDRHWRIVIPHIKIKLEQLKLSKSKSRDKFIPDLYKYNTREVRLELIRGLFDTDGHIGYDGNPEYTTTSLYLANDTIEILRSLGINCNMNIVHNSYGPVYKVRAYTFIPLFKLYRKAKSQRVTKTRNYKTAIVDVTFSHREMSKCVTVDSKDSCYLIGDYVTTHNSKGTNASEHIKAYARRCNRDWLLKPVEEIVGVRSSEDGEITDEVTITKNLFFIPFRALLEELATWNPDGNFDRHDALGMLMLLREDKLRLLGTQSPSEAMVDRYSSSLAEDDFFTKNYRSVNQADSFRLPKRIQQIIDSTKL